MYEIEGKTFEKIANEIGTGSSTILSWAKKENWLAKGAESGAVAKFTRDKFVESMAKRGMPSERAMDLLIDGMQNPEIVSVIGIDADDKPIESKKPDYNTRHKYQKDYWKMAGMMDKPGDSLGGITAGEGGTVNVMVNLPALED
jgi:hypothetical protein